MFLLNPSSHFPSYNTHATSTTTTTFVPGLIIISEQVLLCALIIKLAIACYMAYASLCNALFAIAIEILNNGSP